MSRPVGVQRGGAYSRADWEAAVRRRRGDQQKLTGVSDVLADVEHRADEVNRRAAALLGANWEHRTI
ncbi:MAG TPA: hypothetical protein VII33_06120 [Nakamurella sp.]